MQTFQVLLTVTVNSIETVSPTELENHLQPLLDEFDSGNIVIEEIKE